MPQFFYALCQAMSGAQGYGEFRHLLLPHLLPAHRILVLGCGNSSLSSDLERDGCKHVTSVDLSPVVIQHMRKRALADGMPELQWQVRPTVSPFKAGKTFV